MSNDVPKTYSLADLPATCPICGARVHQREPDSVEYWCGTFIDHNPRTDREGEGSIDHPCDED